MDKAILLAVAAGLCTASSSVCQVWVPAGPGRTGSAWGSSCVWLGALVQPILALELLFVFAYMAVLGSRRVQLRDWLAACGMSADSPSSCWPPRRPGVVRRRRVHRGASGTGNCGRRPGRLRGGLRAGPASRGAGAAPCGRRAATGLCWGFVAAVIKEFSSHLGAGAGASPAGRSTPSSAQGQPASCSPPTHWPRARSQRHSPGSRSSTLWRPACWGCSCSASTCGRGRLTWPPRRRDSRSSSAASPPSATATWFRVRMRRRQHGRSAAGGPPGQRDPSPACTPGSSQRASHPGRASASLPLTPARHQPHFANSIRILYSLWILRACVRRRAGVHVPSGHLTAERGSLRW